MTANTLLFSILPMWKIELLAYASCLRCANMTAKTKRSAPSCYKRVKKKFAEIFIFHNPIAAF